MYSIKCKQLIDGTGKEPLENAVVVIEGERITQVGTADSVTVPDDCEIVDASSHTVMPGMMDAHVHVRMTGDPLDQFGVHTEVTELLGTTVLKAYVSAKRDLESGFTAIRDIASRCYEDIALRNAINEGLIQGP
ncbi:MAG: amidohydrolase family protein, partial [Anaerolineales bacterium]|nr:amidohydrolase family protein [Anaerolineales bacterium]